MSTQLRRSSRIRRRVKDKANEPSLQSPRKKRRLNTKKKSTSKPVATKKKESTNDDAKTTSSTYISKSGKHEPSTKKKKSPYYDNDNYSEQTLSINQNIADRFHELAELEKLNLNISRAAQARRTARAIESISERIEHEQNKKLKKYPGIGKKSAESINEILETNTLARIEELKHRKKYEKDEGKSLRCKNKKNEQLASIFEELAMYEFDDEDTSRGAMFRLMAKRIRNMKQQITSGEQIEKYRGFGPSAKQIVNDYLKTGKVERLENFKKHFGTPRQHLQILYRRRENKK